MFKKLLFLLLFTHYSLLIATAQWVQVSNGLGNSWIPSLAGDGNTLFAGTQYYPMGFGVYLSTNNGTNWTQTSLIYGTIYSLAISGNNVFAGEGYGGGQGVYLSTNNGTNWTQTSLSNRIVYSLAATGNNVFAGTGDLYGVYRTTNNGTNWTQTLSNQIVYSLAANGNYIFAGTWTHGVYMSTNTGVNWSQTSLSYGNIHSLAVNGINIFAGTSDATGVYLSTNNGTSWTQTSLNNRDVYALAVNGNNIFAGTFQYGVYVSNNNGASWIQRNEGLGNLYISSFCILNNYIFAGTLGVYRRPLSELTGNTPISEQIPSHYALEQNYPNPFNPTTKIRFDNPPSPLSERGDRGGFVRLIVYDILGREVATLVNESLKPGTYEVDFDASNYPSGIYFYTLLAGEFNQTNKMILIK